MKRLRIRFPVEELELMKNAVAHFNDSQGYLDEIGLQQFHNHQAILISPAESAMFVQSYLEAFPEFSKLRLRADIIKEIENRLMQEPNNLPAQHALQVLKTLSF